MALHEVTQPVVYQRTDRTIECELCGAMARDGEWQHNPHSMYEHTAVEISIKKEQTYPDNYSSEGEAYDCCPTCFRDKVRPALLALGLKPRKTSAG